MEYLDLAPVTRATGTVSLPGSKSISNRTLLLAALAHGRTLVKGLLDADDVDRMREALAALGVDIERNAASRDFVVHGVAGDFPNKHASLFLGNAGTAFRPLTAALALSSGQYELSGVPRMHERPIADLVNALRSLGAEIAYLGVDAHIRRSPSSLPGDQARRRRRHSRARIDFQSVPDGAMLMALPLDAQSGQPWKSRSKWRASSISKPYIEITLNLMRRFGVAVERDGWQRFRLATGAQYRSPTTLAVEGDASSASYFLAAGAIGGGPVRVTGIGRDSIQGDVRFVDSLQAMGAAVTWGDNWIEVRREGTIRAIDADFNSIPDAAMTLAVVALFAEGTSTLRNIASWRVKETDRIAAMATELRKVGAQVDEGNDWLRVSRPATWIPATIATYDDPRLAMCISLAAFGGVPIRINDPQCVRKTAPGLFRPVLRRLAR